MRRINHCMGGWCKRRDECSMYLSPLVELPQQELGAISERVCAPGRDMPDNLGITPVRFSDRLRIAMMSATI